MTGTSRSRAWPARRPGGCWGGSLIVMDLGRGMTVSYMMNKMGAGVVGSDRSEAYLGAIYTS